MRIMRLDDPTELASYDTPDGWQRLSREEIARQAPQRSLVAVHEGALVARCSLWWDDVPALGDDRLGVIGHYGALDRGAALAMLDAACGMLAEEGRTRAVGPMDGNTWQRYRLVVERGTEPPFFLEPDNPSEWPTHFTDAGFSPLARYLSALNDDLGQRDPRAAAVADRLAETGVRVRELDASRFDEELARIYRVAVRSFQDAFLYTPLSEAAFISQYRAIQPLVRPELVLLAERDGDPVGFAFSVPDALEAARGAPPRTVVFKTLAILPDRRAYSGLGSLMADRTHASARALGYTRAIHALIHESNYSRAVSERTGRTIRRYALFARALANSAE
jgi:L-amino acid N-acyltransferase YncA